MDASLVPGFLTYVALAMAPAVMLYAALRLPRLLPRVRLALIRSHLWRRPPEPLGRPLEQLAADLRRLYAAAHYPQPGVRMPKQRGVLMAYDQRLLETARALEITTHLTDCPLEGYDRSAERLRLELALADAGLVWRLPEGWAGQETGVDPAA
jgi:hypothetical protein